MSPDVLWFSLWVYWVQQGVQSDRQGGTLCPKMSKHCGLFIGTEDNWYLGNYFSAVLQPWPNRSIHRCTGIISTSSGKGYWQAILRVPTERQDMKPCTQIRPVFTVAVWCSIDAVVFLSNSAHNNTAITGRNCLFKMTSRQFGLNEIWFGWEILPPYANSRNNLNPKHYYSFEE